MFKKLKWVAVALVLLVVVALGVVWWNLNSIVRTAVERGTGRSLALNTTLGSATVGLFTGNVGLSDLKVGNPEGFSAPQLLTLGNVSVDTSYGKLFGETVGINSVVIDRPKLTIEFKGMKSNLKTVADNLMKTQQGEPAPSPSPAPPPAPADAKPVKLIIDYLKVSGAQVEIISDLPGLNVPYVIDIPAVELQSIGNADGNRNGEEMGKVVSQLITALTIEAQKSGKLPPQLATILNGDVDQLIGQIGGAFAKQAQQLEAQARERLGALETGAREQVGNLQKQGQEQLDNAKREAEQRLGGFLGGGEKKDEPKKDDRK